MEALVKSTFDFVNNSIETLDLETLTRTYKENCTDGTPQQGIYHFILIQKMLDICKKHGLDYQVEEIFAAQNKHKTFPGVTINPEAEQIYGEKAVEAHALRRVFTTVQILNGQTEELTTTLAIAYHQDGIQVAIGPNVKICHNQCVLSAERSACSFGKGKVSIDGLFEKVDEWLENYDSQMNEDRERIRRLQSTVLSPMDIINIIGLLTSLRIAHDSKEKRLSEKVKVYPLNQGQISIFGDNLLKLQLQKENITAWDVYNVATELYKPGKTDIPALIDQNAAFADFILKYCIGEYPEGIVVLEDAATPKIIRIQ